MASVEIPAHRYLGGTEMEYPAMLMEGVRCSPGPNPSFRREERPLKDNEVVSALEHTSELLKDPEHPEAFAGVIGAYCMASNGARIYKDVGQKIEYATPEAKSYRDTVHAGIAGEQIVVGALKRFAQTVAGRRVLIRGCAGNKDGISWGRHQSYLLDRRAYPPIEGTSAETNRTRLLCRVGIAHLATRQLFTGGGTLMSDLKGGEFHYERSQKIPSLQLAISSGTTGMYKGIFNTRDEPHAEKDKYFRWHVTPGDYNLSPWAAWIELGVTDLLGYLVFVQTITGKGNLERLSLKTDQELAIAKAISRDENAFFKLESGDHVQAVDIQEMICAALEELNSSQSELFTAEDREIMDELRFAVDAQRNNPEALSLCVDWRKRQEIINAYKEKYPNADFTTLHKVEQFWDNLDGGKGVQLRELTRMPGYDVAHVAYLRHSPPEGTRAFQRSHHIKSHDGTIDVNDTDTNWGEVVIRHKESGVRKHYKLMDPFDTTSTLPQELAVAS